MKWIGFLLCGSAVAAGAAGIQNSSPPPEQGEVLVERYCSSCHLPPAPEILPRRSWPFVIEWMGNYLGYVNLEGSLANLVHLDRVPPQPLLERHQLEAIRSYLVAAAPLDPLPQPAKQAGEKLSLFQSRTLPLIDSDTPLLTLLKIDPEQGRIFVGDGLARQALVFTAEGELRERHKLNSQPVEVHFRPDGFDLTMIGDLDRDRHSAQIIRYRREGARYHLRGLLTGYHRTAHTHFADVNQDGREDLIVSAFGDYDKGRFAWFEQGEDGRLREHILIERSGALKADFQDYTGDGRPDIAVLMAQGRNEMILFEGREDGSFRERQLFEQMPGFGYHEFHTTDFDGDGAPDLVVVNGNNMEMDDAPLRSYHGVRIYLNDGRGEFRERFFYPMHGAIKAVSADFDQDGDLDLAAISYFPDWSLDSPESFVYLENLGDFRFLRRHLKEAAWGRWMTMDSGDLDRDGDIDLILGNGYTPSGIPTSVRDRFIEKFNKAPVLLLENQLR